MKRLFALTLMGLMLTVVFAACGSSKGTQKHCDAYGSAPATMEVNLETPNLEQSDLKQ